MDREGRPIPWWTYPALYWLDGVLRGSEDVLEFGAGHSTLWLAARAARVTSVEHDPDWANRISRRAPANVTVQHRACTGDLLETSEDDPYVEAIRDGSGARDVVVVDGMARNTCLRGAPRILRRDGLILLDNADRPAFREAIGAVLADGFFRLDLIGPVPGGTNFSCTSVFSRELDGRWGRPAQPPAWWGDEIADFGVV